MSEMDYTYAERYGRTGKKYATPIDDSVTAGVVAALGDSLELDEGLTGAIADNILADLITDAGGDPETDAYVDSLIAALVADATYPEALIAALVADGTYPAAIGDALEADADFLAAIKEAILPFWTVVPSIIEAEDDGTAEHITVQFELQDSAGDPLLKAQKLRVWFTNTGGAGLDADVTLASVDNGLLLNDTGAPEFVYMTDPTTGTLVFDFVSAANLGSTNTVIVCNDATGECWSQVVTFAVT